MALSRRIGRSRFTLVLLVLTSITLLTLDFRGFGPIDSARSGGAVGLRPGRRRRRASFRPVGNLWNGAFEYDDLERRRTSDLRAQVDDLQGQMASGQVTREQ